MFVAVENALLMKSAGPFNCADLRDTLPQGEHT